MKKHSYARQLKSLKQLTRQINRLFQKGQWNEISDIRRIALTNALRKIYNSLKFRLRNRRLTRVLGAALILVSANSSAQDFAPRESNPFDIESGLGYLIAKPVFGDFDNDGDLDVLINNYEYGNYYYQENIGDAETPEFGEVQINPFGLEATEYIILPQLADIDGDGDLDILSTELYGGLQFVENIGDAETPEFTDPVGAAFGLTLDEYTFIIDVVDIDDDGDLDIFYSSYDAEEGTNNVSFTENIGTATDPEFGAFEISPFSMSSFDSEYILMADFGDLDGDGDYDFFRTNIIGQTIYYHENTGDAETADFSTGGVAGAFDLPDLEEGYFTSPELADIDDDGDLDLFIGEYYGIVYFHEHIDDLDCLGEIELVTTDVTCFDGEDGIIEVDVSDLEAPWTYDIGDGPEETGIFGGLSAGDYTVVVSDASGCEYEEEVTLIEPSPIVVDFDIDPEALGDDGAIDATVSGGVGSYTFAWTGPDGFVSTDEDISGLVAGMYELTVVDANGCLLIVTDVEVSSTVSIGEEELGLSIYPNPSNDGIFTLENEGSNLSAIRVMDLTGRVIYNSIEISSNGIQTIDLSSVADGTYLVELRLADRTQLKKVIKK